MNEDWKDYLNIVVFLFFILSGLVLLGSCNGGWVIAEVDINPSDTVRADFMIISDQDSIKHWYVRTTKDGGILVGDNWCHKHEQWEKVKKK